MTAQLLFKNGFRPANNYQLSFAQTEAREYPELCGFDLICFVPQSQKAKGLSAIDEEPLLRGSTLG